jgi:hypothetical protein
MCTSQPAQMGDRCRDVTVLDMCDAQVAMRARQLGIRSVPTEDGFLMGKRFLLVDRDPLYTTAFRELLRAAGVAHIRLPPSSPNLNAYAERFVRSIKRECLGKLVLLGENHLRTSVREYVTHYHTERNH